MPTRRKAVSDPTHSRDYNRHIWLMERLTFISQLNQQRSPLLRLPAELRNKVYQYVFPSQPICPFRNLRGNRGWGYPRRLLSLLRVCRQTYAEARLLPFTINVFVGYAERVIVMLLDSFTPEQTNAISRVRLFADAFGIYGDSDSNVPDVGLQAWFVKELGELGMVEGLKELELIWFGSKSERVQEGLRAQVCEVLEKASRADIDVKVDCHN